MAEHLASGLLEACVVVGISNDKLKEVYESQQQETSIPPPQFDPEILQVHSPPFVTKESLREPGLGGFGRGQCRRSFIKKTSDRSMVVPGSTTASEQPKEDVSVPKHLDLVALPQLCFPGGLQVSKEQRDDHFHFLVFTDVFGNQTHGVVVQYYRLIQLFQEGMQCRNGHGSKAPRLHIPYSVCVISKQPYYTALKDCLSCLLGQLKTCRMADFDERVKEFAAKLSLVPVPPPGPLHVMFTLRPLTIVLPSREDKDHPVVDLDLHLPFLCFRPRTLLQIMTSILTEQRLVFFSSDWARLTLVAECFMLYIRPLRWHHPLVPVLSRQMLDFLMAPTAFLMGCHLSHYKEVAEETDDLILINIDEGTISSDSANIPEAPCSATQCFKRRSRSLQLHYDVHTVHQGTCVDINDLRVKRRKWQQSINWEIQKVTLEFLVNVFRDVSDHLNYEHRVFNTEEFLKTRESQDQPFYKKVLETYVFHSFLKERLCRKTDAFTRMELDTRTEAQKIKAGVEILRRPTMQELAWKHSCPETRLSKRLGASLPNLGEENQGSSPRKASFTRTTSDSSLNIPAKPVRIFKLPDFPPPLVYHYVHHYYTEVTHQLKKAMASLPSGDSGLLARYYYLRGLINTLNSKHLEALSDFQNLYKTDIELFPGELVQTLVDSLQKEEKAEAERRPELRRLLCRPKSDEKTEAGPEEHVRKFTMPKGPLRSDEFVKVVQECGIVRDVATIHRLFEALTDGPQKVVDPELFRVFYTFWKETEAEAQDVHLPSEVIDHLDNDECVYKLSSSVRTNHGVGKIAMTQKRLFLLTDGRPGYVEITKFRDIEDIKISASPILLLRVPSLKIKSTLRKEVFEANLKTECDLWSLMAKEMWAGRRMADDHKDPQHVHQALTNVLLMDAVVGCLQSPKAALAASTLAYYDKMKREVPVTVPKSTVETLKHRINPSLCMVTPQAVDVLLYTPGQLTFSDGDQAETPKLWCGLSSGTVVVFDAATWSMQHNCIQVGTKQLNCMLGLDQEQVWIGSQDSVIYIINTRSMSCHKQLTEHRAEVTAFALEERSLRPSHTQLYSCSADGSVIVWDVLTLKVKKQFHLDCEGLKFIELYNGTLWCGGKDCMVELRKHGVIQRKISLPGAAVSTASTFSSFLLLAERGELWISSADSGELWVRPLTGEAGPCDRVTLPGCSGVTCMIRVKNQVWVGGHAGGPGPSGYGGKIFVLDSERRSSQKELQAHADSVRALCSAEDRYVLSGSAKRDGKIAIWKVE
ncbi:DENN domain-containing protein 3 [Electrophorus electricus]|uniref:DENN domain-containing protein 3 n=1 Tax=Electrophorus electricus TaxID=8005 RepID=UPI0015CFA029|nr:DENN domain-containing protein 3 [Electrophorus electricus]